MLVFVVLLVRMVLVLFLSLFNCVGGGVRFAFSGVVFGGGQRQPAMNILAEKKAPAAARASRK